jgi:hypothetical protein
MEEDNIVNSVFYNEQDLVREGHLLCKCRGNICVLRNTFPTFDPRSGQIASVVDHFCIKRQCNSRRPKHKKSHFRQVVLYGEHFLDQFEPEIEGGFQLCHLGRTVCCLRHFDDEVVKFFWRFGYLPQNAKIRNANQTEGFQSKIPIFFRATRKLLPETIPAFPSVPTRGIKRLAYCDKCPNLAKKLKMSEQCIKEKDLILLAKEKELSELRAALESKNCENSTENSSEFLESQNSSEFLESLESIFLPVPDSLLDFAVENEIEDENRDVSFSDLIQYSNFILQKVPKKFSHRFSFLYFQKLAVEESTTVFRENIYPKLLHINPVDFQNTKFLFLFLDFYKSGKNETGLIQWNFASGKLLTYFPTLTEIEIQNFSYNFEILLNELAVKLKQNLFQSKRNVHPQNEIIATPSDSTIYVASWLHSILFSKVYCPNIDAKMIQSKKEEITKTIKECV